MSTRTSSALLVSLAAATTCALVGAPPASAAEPKLTLRDSLYVLPLAPAVATPDCVAIFCPSAQPFSDAGAAGVRVTGFPFAPPGVRAEARSEPLPYDGAGEDGTASVAFSADRQAEGSGGTVLTGVRLEDTAGGVVAELPTGDLPVDGTRRTVGPVPIAPSSLTPGRSYVAVATFRFAVPSGSSVSARVFAPRLLALGPRKAVTTTKPFKARAPVARLSGRELRVTARCPTGSSRCGVTTRSTAGGRTLGTGVADLQAGAHHTFTYRLSATQLRRARSAGRIATTLRLKDEKRRTSTARSSLRVPKG